MNQSLIIGQYVPGESVVHKIDPRLKLIIIFIFVIAVFMANNIWSYVSLYFFVFASVALSRIPVAYIFKGLKPVWWIIIITFMFHLFFNSGGNVIVSFLGINVHEQGVFQGASIATRFFLLIVLATLLTLSTTPIAVTDAVESLLKPLKKLRFPVHEIALMMSISLRFIPTFMQEMDKISKAQAARGLDYTKGKLKDRFKALLPLLIPLLISSFKRAEDLALAMEARGYQGEEGRTKLRQLSFSKIDYIVIISLIVFLVSFYMIRV
ncbi:energy-coupling factor transporter transmembrane component T family protein [Alkalibacillus haloalkaliphilus]|uniref:energy-coupling factor transporter transmembrane component T family protein n=1 Tax=Alkalibacillus haloalkaliphilus TaxID=94136 RepID=UPI0029353E45|nr:energy-coupling factor transporter transmembrane protein EcfT [Alkalibacillus haloalkaliphilus]MDV2582639.1 energy-coupling factor transporter transmembrane protein EcfT [Alkalibacillus haloalkaliphilus]